MTTASQAETENVIRDLLSTEFGREVTEILPVPKANNSILYTLSVGRAKPQKTSSTQKQPPPGAEPLPQDATKLVIRFTNPAANLNDAVVVQNEVASMALARNALASFGAQIVPRVYGWKAATGDKTGWVVMEFLHGETLQYETFKNMDEAAKRDVLKQIARVFKLIQQYELPSSVKGYGGLGFAEDGSIIVGPTPIFGATGPCDTYHQLFQQYLKTQLEFMDKCDVVQGWRDTDLRSRIDAFVAEGFTPLLEKASQPNPRQTLVHGDFDLQNLHFDPETHQITAILDFTFSHIASPAEEYFYSFESLQGLLVPPGANDPLRKFLLHGFDAEAARNQPVLKEQPATAEGLEIGLLRDEAFFLAEVLRPLELMPSIEMMSMLHWFVQNISPGLFFIPKVRAKMGPQRVSFMRKHMAEDLARTFLGPWGF